MCVRQREEVDCVAGGITQHRLQDLHRCHALIGRQDHCRYTYTCTVQEIKAAAHTDCFTVSS